MASATLHGPRGRTEEQRFLDMVQRSEVGCWLWVGGIKPNGYGFFAIKRDGRWRKAHAHRYAHELWVGPIPAGYEIDHRCRARHCVRPDHLQAVTLQENRLRRDEARTHCKRGHALTPENLYEHGGWRYCRECRRINGANSVQRRMNR